MSTTQNTANFPGPNAPLDQDGNVVLSQPWFQFFLALLSRTGGNGTPATDVTALLAAVKAVQAQADYQSVVSQDAAILDGLRQIADLAAQMQQSFSDLGPALARLDQLENALMPTIDLSAVFRRSDDIESMLMDLRMPLPQLPEQWIAPTLINSWVNFGSGFNPAGYYKDPFGIVHLRGVVKSGVVGTDIFTLPIGYRPANTELLACVSNGALGIVEPSAAGGVNATAGNNTYFSLDGLTFRAA